MLRMIALVVALVAMPGLVMAGADKKGTPVVTTTVKVATKYARPWSPRPDATGLYGTKSNEKYLSTNLSMLFSKTADFKDKLVRVGGRIVSVCQKKGCWMKITDGKNVMRVRFKGYKFFMPVNSKGYMAVVYGYARQAQIPVRWLRHYAEDRGASKAEIAKITKPQNTVAFTASWVELKKLAYKRK